MLDYFSDYLPAQLIIQLNEFKVYSIQNTKPLKHHPSFYFTLILYTNNKILASYLRCFTGIILLSSFIKLDKYERDYIKCN